MNPPRALNPPTLIAAALLLAAAAGVYGYALATGQHLVKPETDIGVRLYKFPEYLGAYALVEKAPLTKEMTDELGANEYFNRVYGRPGSEAKLTLHVSYHTGKADARPYVSPRCYVAGGVESDAIEQRTLSIKPLGRLASQVPVHLFRVPTEPDAPPADATVVYTHVANGRWVADRDAVSEAMFDPSTPTAWWARVELLVPAGDADEAAAIATDFLAAALPPIMKHLPDAPENTGATRPEPDPADDRNRP